MRELSVGQVLLLGGGAVVQECFIPALDRLGLLDRVTIVDPHAPGRLRGVHRVVQADFRAVLTSGDLAGFTHSIVALPNALHSEAVAGALERGLHVLCEKPLALQAAECSALADLAAAERRVLAVNMIRRLYRSVAIAADAIARGWVGRVHAIHLHHGGLYAWPARSAEPFQTWNGGVLADMGVHYLDLAEHLLGPLDPLEYEDDCAGGVESECRFTLSTASGAAVDVHLSRLNPLSNHIHIVGEHATLRIGVDDPNTCTLEPAHDAAEPIRLTAAAGESRTFADCFVEQLQRFFAAGFGRDQALVGGRSAARTVSLIEWAYRQRRPTASVNAAAARLEPGRVFVTGGSGFIGSHLVARLAGDGIAPVDVAYHTLRSCAAISRFPVRYHGTNLLDVNEVREAVDRARYVFHLAYGRDEGSERAITVGGTKNVVEAAIAAQVEAVVVLSTMYVYGCPDGGVDESSADQPIGGLYGKTKLEMERWCLDRAKTSGRTRIVVLQPTCVYGPRGRTYALMPIELAREGRLCWIGGGAGIANVVYVDNLVDAMIRAATTREAHGQRFIVNDESLTWRDFLTPMLGPWAASVPAPDADTFRRLSTAPPGPGLRDVARALVRSPDVWDTIARTAAANRLRPFIKKHAPFIGRLRRRASSGSADPAPATVAATPPAWLADVFSTAQTRFSSERARHMLGWTPLVPHDEAIARTVEWLRRQRAYGPESARDLETVVSA